MATLTMTLEEYEEKMEERFLEGMAEGANHRIIELTEWLDSNKKFVDFFQDEICDECALKDGDGKILHLNWENQWGKFLSALRRKGFKEE